MAQPMQLTQVQFEELLPLICNRETSQDPEHWTPENPLCGHCAIVSVIAQDLFGGEIKRASLEGNPGFGKGSSHYWNILPDGTEIDFTKSQFQNCYPELPNSVTRTRNYVLFGPTSADDKLRKRFEETRKRYKLLAFTLAKVVSEGNPIFDDQFYQKCFYAALDSSCQKMKFGCVIIHNGEIVYEGCNKTIKPLKSLCEPKCIRFSITSRTESMLGACGHAEEGIWDVIRRGIPIHECELYIAGLHANGLPWLKQAAEHTCLRCAVQMYNAHLKTIYVPVVDQWIGITPEQALDTARSYATKEKTV